VAEAARNGGDVHRGVAAAHHDHALADVLQAAVVEGLEEGRGGNDVGRCRTFGRQRAAGLGTEAEEDGVEVLVDLLHRDIDTDLGLEPDVDAQVEDALDFGVEHITRRAVARDAVAHHAAEVLVVVEDR
jgi:hypothetical protein